MAVKKRGRPLKEIDQNTFEKLCGIQCTETEICNFFGCDDMTLVRWIKRTYGKKLFSEVFAEKRGLGRISLRRTQFRLAEKSPTMAIFLGKQYLGQKDEHELTEMEKHRIEYDNKMLELKEREIVARYPDMRSDGDAQQIVIVDDIEMALGNEPGDDDDAGQ